MKIIKTYESYNLDELDLGRFSDRIEKSKLTKNADGTFDYNGTLNFEKVNLNSLLEIPIRFKNISRSFSCYKNNLISLEGAPEMVTGNFICNNNNLISLRGAPLYVGGTFYCSFNNLISKVRKTKIGGIFYSSNYHLLEISQDVIQTVKRMTHEQQMAELEFFVKHDTEAYEIMLNVLDELGVDVKQRKDMLDYSKSLITHELF